MDNANEIITANIQQNLQHIADVQHELVETPKTAAQWQD
jgi:hypothetical protein